MTIWMGCRAAAMLAVVFNAIAIAVCVAERNQSTVNGSAKCARSNESGCSVYLHDGKLAEHTITLKRYNVPNSPSIIQMAAKNQELFKSGHISFAKRGQGTFGSIGYGDRSHGRQDRHLERRWESRNLRVFRRSDYAKYIPIRQTKDSLYIGEIKIGTPPQTFHPIFDTGSTNLWVVGTSCRDTSCLKVPRYDTSRSKTFHALDNPLKIHVKFGTGEIEGYPATDTVAIGNIAIPNQSFAVVESEQSGTAGDNIFDKIDFEGIVGLAFPEMSSVPGKPIFDHMALLKNMKQKEFAFYIDDNDEGSKIMFGGVDPDCYEGEIKMFPVVREHYWEVKLDAVYVGKEKLCSDEKMYLIFDSGTSLNTIPSDQFGRFMSYFPPKACNDTFEGYPTITYVLGGEHIKLEPQQYMMKQQGACIPAYMQLDVPSEFGHAFILGSNAFMRHYLTVFRRGDATHPSMVGIAPSKHSR